MGINAATVAALRQENIDWRFKAAPLPGLGTVAELIAARPPLSSFGTPLLTLDDAALDHNIATMAAWAAAAGVTLAPHGKTTMAPALWQRQLDAGAWAITVANVAQLRVARAFGVERVMLAAPLLHPAALAWVRAQEGFEVTCWADSVRAVELMAADGRPLDVCVELGAPGGRTGARTTAEALEVAEAVRRAPGLRLIGVAGYEGAVAHDREPASLAAVDDYLGRVAKLAMKVSYETDQPIVTAGGSAYFDRVTDVLADGAGAKVVLRAGAYVISDDGYYRGVSPLRHTFRSAMHGWARVISRPEPELALLDAGKRDLPFDEGLPVPRGISGAHVSAMADQHTFLRLPPEAAVAVGDVVRLGLSHPCTALDKWQLIPVVDDADADSPRVVDAVRTFF